MNVLPLLALACLAVLTGCIAPLDPGSPEDRTAASYYRSCKPLTRWWWFAAEIGVKDVEEQLDWVKANDFGGVEIAWIYPVGRDPEAVRDPWLGEAWSQAVRHAKEYADSIELHCDFTFGTLWPFGGSFVPDSDRTRVFGEPEFKQKLRLSWEHPTIGNVIDHMDRGALERYSRRMLDALSGALSGSRSALFCDSWEVETRRIWTDGFSEMFQDRFGYDIRPFMEEIYDPGRGDERYDYMKLVSETVIANFFEPFTKISREAGAFSRVQCGGSPTDLIDAFASVDVPESEAMLYEPSFARIPASAAALAASPLVSAETFTCLYGFPGEHLGDERLLDLKLVADALFANGVNQIVWHGMPYNRTGDDSNRFYATVHVGRQGRLASELPAFNRYMEKVSAAMRKGRTYSDVAVYLPIEDGWIAGEYPKEKQFPWAWGAYELRYVAMPDELRGYHPLWINRSFLEKGVLRNKTLFCGGASFSSLYVDVDYLDSAALDAILALAGKGFPVCLKRRPAEPGRMKSGTFEARLDRLEKLDNVSGDFTEVAVNPPLVSGEDLPDHWCRFEGETLYLYFSHPAARDLALPLSLGQADKAGSVTRKVRVTREGRSREVILCFAPCQSLLLEMNGEGEIRFLDVAHEPGN